MNDQDLYQLINENVEAIKDEIIAFCQALIQKKSVNPPGNEKEAAQLIVSKLKENNIEINVVDYSQFRGNLIATLPGIIHSPRLLFNGHIDVVPVPEDEHWKVDPFGGIIKRRRIWGRGAVDMKGNCSAMLMAAVLLKRIGIPLNGDLILNFVADEEQGGIFGTKWCIETHPEKLKADATVIGEPTTYPGFPLLIMIGEKGIFWLRITTYGQSAHASTPMVGDNPILRMLHVIQAIEDNLEYGVKPPYNIEELKERASAVFGTEQFQRIYEEQGIIRALFKSLVSLTHAVTIIKAGEKENQIPDQCSALIDFRLTPSHTPDELLRRIKRVITDLGPDFVLKESKDDPNGNVLLKVESSQAASLMKNSNTPLISVIKEAHHTVFQKPTFQFLMPATSDARFFRNDNIAECRVPSLCDNTVLFGGGNGMLAHAKDESIEIKTLLSMTKAYALIAAKYLS
ncbi:MAG: M20 family metallopeptidase [Candidatus Helarchaeota archaeon]